MKLLKVAIRSMTRPKRESARKTGSVRPRFEL